MTEMDPLKKIEKEMDKLQKKLDQQRGGISKERSNMFTWAGWSGAWFGLFDAPIIAGLSAVGVVWSAADMAAHSWRAKGIKKRLNKLEEQSDAIELARATDPRWIEQPKMTEKFNQTAEKIEKIEQNVSEIKKELDTSKGPDFRKFD